MRTGGGDGSATVMRVTRCPERVAPRGDDVETELRVGRAIDTCDDSIDAERSDRGLIVGVGVDDGGTSDDDRLTAAFDDVSRGGADEGS